MICPMRKVDLVPTKEWKLKRGRKKPWQMGETISTSIGQGFNLTTPLQLANAFSAFANGGTLWRPRLVKYIESTDGKIYKEFLPEKKGELKLSQKTVEILNSALWGVVNEPGGTGHAARMLNVDVCGKTGTSQVLGLPADEKARTKIIRCFSKRPCFVCLLRAIEKS